MAYAAWSVVFGEQPSAAKWNILGTNDAYFDSIVGSGTAWSSWTPTLSGRFDNAKWTKVCAYTVIGKTCIFRIRLVANAATPMSGGSGDATFSLPGTTATYSNTASYEIGKAGIFDTSAPFSYDGTITLASTTTANIKIHSAGGTYTGIDGIISTAPMTWASGDEITGTGIIEVA